MLFCWNLKFVDVEYNLFSLLGYACQRLFTNKSVGQVREEGGQRWSAPIAIKHKWLSLAGLVMGVQELQKSERYVSGVNIKGQ